MSSPEQLPGINFPTEDELRASAQRRFEDIRKQQELDRQAAQGQATEIFGEGTLGRVEEGRSQEISDILQQRQQQLGTGAAGLDESIARRQQTIATGGQDPAFQQIEEAARRAQDIQTQTSLRQLRGDLGAQGVRGGINVQNQLATLGRGNLAESQLQAQLAQARLGRVGEAETSLEGLQRTRIAQQADALGASELSTVGARAEEAGRADVNVQRALQERLGRLQLTESRAQAGTLERAAASQEVTAGAQLRAQLEQQNIANQIAFTEANKPAAQPQTVQSGGKVLCTEMHRQGLISDEVMRGDDLYALQIPIATKIGYWVWAKPLAEKCETSKLLTSMALPFVKGWATEMAFRAGVVEEGSFLGRLMTKTFEPVCNLLGRALIHFDLVNMAHLTSHITYNK